MWVEELQLENIKCFEKQSLRFSRSGEPYRWVTFLSENAGGKTTALQALALLLAGPESVNNLLPRPLSWLTNESRPGLISTRIHQEDHDPGQYGDEKISRAFGYSFHVVGRQPLTIRNRRYNEPAIIQNADRHLTWLRQNAFVSGGTGWFAAGYGAFKRLSRDSQIIIPSLEPQARFKNFSTQFNEEEPLSSFEIWMVYLDYRITKTHEANAIRQRDIGIAAINELLPEGVTYDSVTDEGRVLFNIHSVKVPTISLSDGYRSILSFAGDLIWRLINAFPESEKPLHEEGVVLIDELDIHLHPLWQRKIAGLLRTQFPNIQFIVATHSPLIAAGAGADALTLKFDIEDGKSVVKPIDNISFLSVDAILQSEAFGLVSPFSPQMQGKIDRYDSLARKGNSRKPKEESEYQTLLDFMEETRPFGGHPTPGSLNAKIDEYLQKALA